jgi:hypothetical protein
MNQDLPKAQGSVLKGGRVQQGPLPARFAAIVKRYAVRTGLDPAAYAGHSLLSRTRARSTRSWTTKSS